MRQGVRALTQISLIFVIIPSPKKKFMGQIDGLTILIFITYPRLGIFSYLKFYTSPTVFFSRHFILWQFIRSRN